MLKILVTGPESTGKSSLVEALAKHFKTSYVSEFARDYIAGLSRPYIEEDLLEIARKQVSMEEEALEKKDSILFIDTDLTVMDIWSQEKYGRTHPWILEQMQKRAYDLCLVPDIDLHWTFDPQRENPSDRERLMKKYQESFESRNINYQLVRGEGEKRVQHAINLVEGLLKNAI